MHICSFPYLVCDASFGVNHASLVGEGAVGAHQHVVRDTLTEYLNLQIISIDGIPRLTFDLSVLKELNIFYMYKCKKFTNVQMYKCPNVQIYKRTNVQTYKCTHFLP